MTPRRRLRRRIAELEFQLDDLEFRVESRRLVAEQDLDKLVVYARALAARPRSSTLVTALQRVLAEVDAARCAR